MVMFMMCQENEGVGGNVWVGLLVCFLTSLAHCENAAVGVAVVMLCDRWF